MKKKKKECPGTISQPPPIFSTVVKTRGPCPSSPESRKSLWTPAFSERGSESLSYKVSKKTYTKFKRGKKIVKKQFVCRG